MNENIGLAEALATCNETAAMEQLRKQLEQGVPAVEVLHECNRGMIELGNRFSDGDCFLPDLMFGGIIMKNIMAELGPKLAAEGGAEVVADRPKAVIGTVRHDVHDIGKDIVVMMLTGAGFEVIDLGVDVPAEKFVEAIQTHSPVVTGMSLLLTTCFESVVKTVKAIEEAGLRETTKLMVGGAAATQRLAETAGCDFYGPTAVDAMHYATEVAGINK